MTLETDPLIVKTEAHDIEYREFKKKCMKPCSRIIWLIIWVLVIMSMIAGGLYLIITGSEEKLVKCRGSCDGLITYIIYDNSTSNTKLYFDVYCGQSKVFPILLSLLNTTEYYVGHSYTLYEVCKTSYSDPASGRYYSLEQTYIKEENALRMILGLLILVFGIAIIMALVCTHCTTHNSNEISMMEYCNMCGILCGIICNLPHMVYVSYYGIDKKMNTNNQAV